MSYILEALKKAQAERQLGSTPGIHDAPAPSAVPVAAQGQARLWMAAGAALLLAAGGLAILRTLTPREAPAAPDLPAPATMRAAVTPAAAPVPVAVAPPAQEPASKAAIEAAQVAQVAPAPEPVPQPPAAAQQAQPDEALPTLASLPPSVASGIPPVTLGGYIYSPVPSERLLLVDKDLRREGEEVAPGLVLEKLMPSGAVMNYRGTRFRIPY